MFGLERTGCELRRTEAKGVGVFATRPFRRGETVLVGEIARRLDANDAHASQVGPSEYVLLAGLGPKVNHSCDPNCGIVGSILLVTRRDVDAGEELCFDYAMTDSDDYDTFECTCGTDRCRGVVTGDDWKRPELRDRYEGWHSTYLARRLS